MNIITIVLYGFNYAVWILTIIIASCPDSATVVPLNNWHSGMSMFSKLCVHKA